MLVALLLFALPLSALAKEKIDPRDILPEVTCVTVEFAQISRDHAEILYVRVDDGVARLGRGENPVSDGDDIKSFIEITLFEKSKKNPVSFKSSLLLNDPVSSVFGKSKERKPSSQRLGSYTRECTKLNLASEEIEISRAGQKLYSGNVLSNIWAPIKEFLETDKILKIKLTPIEFGNLVSAGKFDDAIRAIASVKKELAASPLKDKAKGIPSELDFLKRRVLFLKGR